VRVDLGRGAAEHVGDVLPLRDRALRLGEQGGVRSQQEVGVLRHRHVLDELRGEERAALVVSDAESDPNLLSIHNKAAAGVHLGHGELVALLVARPARLSLPVNGRVAPTRMLAASGGRTTAAGTAPAGADSARASKDASIASEIELI
jgi:hypothetical protein